MKKYLSLLMLLLVFATAKAQQKIKVDALQLMQLRIAVNPNDTLMRNFKMPALLFTGLQIFIPISDTKFYSNDEVKQLQVAMDKILNPDKYFTNNADYTFYYDAFSKQYNWKKVAAY